MNDKVFVDSNILVYCRDLSEPEKRDRSMAWMEHLWRTRTGRLSYQVLQEFYVVVTQKLRPGLDPALARSDVRLLLAWQPVPADNRMMEAAWVLQDIFGFSWWDALIVAAAKLSGCGYLLSEDLQEGRLFDGIRILNPFRHQPGLAPPCA
jgi:predicted nucleic acid-binding protein